MSHPVTTDRRAAQRTRHDAAVYPSIMPVLRAGPLLLLAILTGACASRGPARPAVELPELAHQVEIRRTTYGVPQIHAENLRAAAFALAYVQLEDHGDGIIRGMQAARGRMALVEGVRRIDADARARQRHARAVETFERLHPDTRDIYIGFAEGMNHFIRVYRDVLPGWMQPDFTGPDILARDIAWPADGPMNAFRQRLAADPTDPAILIAGDAGEWRRAGADLEPDTDATAYRDDAAARHIVVDESMVDDDVGSNAWALAPSRTTSGRAILLRNPHLAWTAGYYEAHIRVPGTLDFYGDFRIGGPFTVIGGFNPFLGFATTNNATRNHEFYALREDPARADHYILDDDSRPLRREVVTVEYREPTGEAGTETREFWTTEFGPVVHRGNGLVYVYRPANMGDFRAGEQWLEMMKATSLEEWKQAMRIGSRSTSNFTYADRDGNIFYVWVAAAPALPHPPGGDSLAILATRSEHVWATRVPFDSLPHVHNPPGGYIRNENDSPHFTNLNAILPDSFYFQVEAPRLRLRSQHGLELLHNDRVFSLEDVIATKHSMRMLLADRTRDDLVNAVRANTPRGDVARAIDLIARWDMTVAAHSRGGVLFELWWNRYRSLMRGEEPHAVPWSIDEPATTPRGIADHALAAQAFEWAVAETSRRFGAFDVPWGDVHRVRRGNIDVPVGGCTGAIGCFRVLAFADSGSTRTVNGGDGWVIAIEFGDTPRAYSVLAYGQSPDPASPWHDNQAAMFADNRMKPVLWTEHDIEAATVIRYRPGQER